MIGILLQLYLKNLCCSCCFVNSEERNAYQSIRAIQTSCKYIIQHPLKFNPNSHNSKNGGSNSTGSTAAVATNFINNLFGSPSKNGGGSSNNQQQNITKLRRVRLILQDSDTDGQPILRIEPLHSAVLHEQQQQQQQHQSPETITDNTIMTIKVRRINKVQLDDNQIVLYNKQNYEILRFAVPLEQQQQQIQHQQDHDNEIMDDNNIDVDNIQLVSTDVRNMLVHHFMVVVEWERQRCIVLKEKNNKNNAFDNNNNSNNTDDSSDDDEDGTNSNSRGGNFITRHAAKVKHYAQREMELQRIQRSRETRKAELIAQAGGLKYTALAMVNK